MRNTKTHERWGALNDDRKHLLSAYVKFAKVTSPDTFPEYLINNDGLRPSITATDAKTKEDLQSYGARGLTTLVAKLSLALFPPTGKFYGLHYYPQDAEAFLRRYANSPAIEDYAQFVANLPTTLTVWENKANDTIIASNVQADTAKVLPRLIVTGNHLLITDTDWETPEWHGIENFVCQRDAQGGLRELILRIWVDESEARRLLDKGQAVDKELPGDTKRSPLGSVKDLTGGIWPYYRHLRREYKDGKIIYKVIHLLGTEELPALTREYDIKNSPYHVLTWKDVPGSDYGVPYIAELYGDLNRLERALRNRSNAGYLISRSLFTIRPNSSVTPQRFANAPNGTVFSGVADDFGTVTMPKVDISQINFEIEDLKQELSRAFLMNNYRQAERVTAEEIQAQANELQQSRANVYHNLATQMQLPIIRWAFARTGINIDAPGETLGIPITPTLVGGYGGLAAEMKVSNIARGLGLLFQLPDAISIINTKKTAEQVWSGLGIPPGDVMLSDEELQQLQQAAMMQQQQQQVAQQQQPA